MERTQLRSSSGNRRRSWSLWRHEEFSALSLEGICTRIAVETRRHCCVATAAALSLGSRCGGFFNETRGAFTHCRGGGGHHFASAFLWGPRINRGCRGRVKEERAILGPLVVERGALAHDHRHRCSPLANRLQLGTDSGRSPAGRDPVFPVPSPPHLWCAGLLFSIFFSAVRAIC